MAVLKRLGAWLPPLFWMAVIFCVSSVPGSDLPDVGIPHFDKAAHFAEFLVLGMLVFRAYAGSFPPGDRGAVVASISLAAAYAAFDEWHQRFVPGRSVDLTDFLADVAGIIVGVFLYRSIMRKERARGSDKAV